MQERPARRSEQHAGEAAVSAGSDNDKRSTARGIRQNLGGTPLTQSLLHLDVWVLLAKPGHRLSHGAQLIGVRFFEEQGVWHHDAGGVVGGSVPDVQKSQSGVPQRRLFEREACRVDGQLGAVDPDDDATCFKAGLGCFVRRNDRDGAWSVRDDLLGD